MTCPGSFHGSSLCSHGASTGFRRGFLTGFNGSSMGVPAFSREICPQSTIC